MLDLCATRDSPLSLECLLDCLYYHGDALPNAYAHRREPKLHVRAAPHLVHQGGEDPRPRSPQGVPQRDRASVRIESLVLWVHPPFVQTSEHLCGEGLIDRKSVV